MARCFEFGDFRLNERERTLLRAGVPVKVTPKAFDVLCVLLGSGNTLVEKDTLLRMVWGDVHVDEAVLARAISDLRKALGQTERQEWIETVPKFGYRFAAEVHAPRMEAPGEASPPGKSRLWLQATVLAIILVAILLAWGATRPGNRIHRLAVMPFQVVGGPAHDAALSVGLADALITRLSNLDGLVVRPLSAVRRFELDPTDPLQAAKQLDADVVLEGTVQFSEGSVRAGIRLIRATDGKALWAESIESQANRLFALEDSIAEEVAAKLALHLQAASLPGGTPRRELNPEAHLLYVDGRYEWGKRSREGLERGAAFFRQAIEAEPSYARAFSGLADCYLLLGAYGYYPQLEMLPKAKVTALRALQLDPDLAEAHATLGLINENLDWDWKEAERQYRESIRLATNYSTAHHWYAEFLSILGRFEESGSEFARAREIDPISPIVQVDEAQLYFFERNYGRNLELLEQVARHEPSFALARERIAFTYMMLGREEDAFRTAMTLPDCAANTGDCRRIWTAWLPRRDASAARAALQQLEADALAGRVPPHVVMFGHLRQTHEKEALDWLDRMASSHAVWLITAKVNPIFDPVRQHPRAKAVLAKLHLM
ncbi:winged helix-turn-helix domain-containing protein [Paludibaculum fermentans]|uniref:Winged helix-turn-helix domain-containing protein n=1 Tax=Paludibaculum fermentans TaxID=1473598 RepID=A0A7S7NUG6_PALFE|nr:winged helix-turn-helix domain-containing protein [Paludibaculum fermentans]QOY90047.1 winged helix-turn-helix domain-containing protein [Paludibaculum fermentans]